MDAATTPVTEEPPQSKRWFAVTPAIELAVLALAIAVAGGTWAVLSGQDQTDQLLTPPLVALLLIANLATFGSLIVLIGRRVAKRRASETLGGGALHVRLVAIFSLLAAVPTVLLAVIASLLFQYGAEFWFSSRTQGMLENTQKLAQESYAQLLSYVENENVAMATDLYRMLNEQGWATDSQEFKSTYGLDVFQRSLANSILFSISPKGEIITHAVVKNSDRSPALDIQRSDIQAVLSGKQSVTGTNPQRTYSLTRVLGTDYLLFSTREVGAAQMAGRLERVRAVYTDYEGLLTRTRALQLQFNIALLIISLIVICIVVVIALRVADRLVRPITELVGAARDVAEGNLGVRVPEPKTQDEVGVLANAFNRMTERLQGQTNALVAANAESESRRALIEAVMTGVSAGVISIASDRRIQLINTSAMAMLRQDAGAVGQPLGSIAPELDALLDGSDREAVVQVSSGVDPRTLAVKITRDDEGQVLTFDDITQQLLDQRRAAWSDVARRIAHEIKNPLTPIQLAAERLQRRYGKKIEAEDGTFTRLTETIVRQVGDLRRIVDEFSSFARMPKPIFRPESLIDIARQAMFLHEVAHPAIRFETDMPDGLPNLVSDRRQIGQALTNIVKNAVEAIEGRGEGTALPQGEVALSIRDDDGRRLILTVTDNGIGLPVERDRIFEPYMTTRSRGTGLGLAIVKKIIEEHFGTIAFTDREGGGTVVTICFDTELLATMAGSDTEPADGADIRPAALTRGNAKS